MKTKARKQPELKKTWVIIGVIAALLAAIVLLATNVSTKTNYAKETAAPLEKALANAGATKICDGGDNGYGADNQKPNYHSVYQTNLDVASATKLIENTASDNGFNLKLAESAYPEIHSYYDYSKPSTSTALLPGTISLGVSLYEGGDHLDCPGQKLNYDPNHTAIKLDIALPKLK